jgi:peroxiredoxin
MKLIALALTLSLSFVAGHSTQATEGIKVGEKAVSFNLKGTDGKMHTLAELAPNGAILVFTCNHCPFSKAYEDRIISLQNAYGAKGYPVIAINPNDPKKQPEDSFDKMQERAKEKNFNFPYLFDDTQAIAKAYGAVRTPHVFIVKKSGTAYNVEYIGAIDDNSNEPTQVSKKYVESAVESLIAGKKPQPDNTRAIGCTIKWRES